MEFPYVLEAGWKGGTVALSRHRFLADMVPGLGDPEYLALLDPETLRLRLVVDVTGMSLYAPAVGNPEVSHTTLYPGDHIKRIFHALQAERREDGSERATGQLLIVEVERSGGNEQLICVALDTRGERTVSVMDGRRNGSQSVR